MNIELNYGLALVLAHKNTKAIVIFFIKRGNRLFPFLLKIVLRLLRDNYSFFIKTICPCEQIVKRINE